MAKLKANGRFEIYRMVKENHQPKSDLISWERDSVAIMSDGAVLKKHDVVFLPNVHLGEVVGRRHSYGWRVAAKAKLEKLTALEMAERLKVYYSARGFELDK